MSTAIAIENLKFSWHTSSREVLKIEKFEVKNNESVFVKGPSGSGKSTLLNIIGGVIRANSGHVNVLGTDFMSAKDSHRDRLRGEKMGFLFQQFNLIPYLSVLENVLLPVRLSKLRRSRLQAAERADIAEAKRLLADLKLNVNTLIHRKVTELSVGQQQRVAAARALIGRPELVIADEPTSALDRDSRDKFIEVLFEECKKESSTLIFVSHDSTLSSHFTRTIDLTEVNKAYIKEDEL